MSQKKLILTVLLIAVFAVVIPMYLIKPQGFTAGGQHVSPPWEVKVTPDGHSEVFGLTLGRSTMTDAVRVLGKDMEIGIISAPGEVGNLEAYYQNITLGFVTGKMVMSLPVPRNQVAQMRARAVKSEFMESTTRKSTLTPEDEATAMTVPIDAIALIPSVSLDKSIIEGRFGKPAQVVRTSDHVEHYLYPDKGIDVVLDSKGKDILQYVAPADFHRLAMPLQAKTADVTRPEAAPAGK